MTLEHALEETGVGVLVIGPSTRLSDGARIFAAMSEALLERFVSGEGATLTIEQRAYAAMLLDYASAHAGVGALELTPIDVEYVVLYAFPRQVACDPSRAHDILIGVRALVAFLERDGGMVTVGRCGKLLDGDAAVARLERRLADRLLWGPAKRKLMSDHAVAS